MKITRQDAKNVLIIKNDFSDKIESRKKSGLDYLNESKSSVNNLLADIHHTKVKMGAYEFIRIEFKDCVMDISEYSLSLTIAAIKFTGKAPIEITKEELHEAQIKKLGIFPN